MLSIKLMMAPVRQVCGAGAGVRGNERGAERAVQGGKRVFVYGNGGVRCSGQGRHLGGMPSVLSFCPFFFFLSHNLIHTQRNAIYPTTYDPHSSRPHKPSPAAFLGHFHAPLSPLPN
jgi:hypothetical protein